MSPLADRRRNTNDGSFLRMTVAAGVIVFVALATYWSFRWGSAIAGVNGKSFRSFGTLLHDQLHGEVTWPLASTLILAGIIVGVFVLVFVVIVQVTNRKAKKTTRVDSAAKLMGTGRDISTITAQHAKKSAAELAPQIETETFGVPIGQLVATSQNLYSTFEDTRSDMAGPRTGKTTSRAVPACLAAPGFLYCTSNKRDLHDATRLAREDVGEVRVFDPQNIVGQEPTWWWNPLSYVVDDSTATALASRLISGSKAGDAKTDGFFDPQGTKLLANYLLAGALAKVPITEVYVWLTRTTDNVAADILNDHDYGTRASMVQSVLAAEGPQRDGIFATAEQGIACVTIRKVARWVTPLGGNFTTDRRPQLDPREFVKGRNTLYSMSKEGPGSASALVTALTAAIMEAAEELANKSPRGRMPVPLFAILDEAANVCRWQELPDLYSHFGSRGIIPMTFLQSPAQAEDVWGRAGFAKLWSASNVKTYGGGVDDMSWLRDRADSIGKFERRTTTASGGAGGRSTTEHRDRELILEANELQDLPRGRAVVWSSGNRAALVKPVPWMLGPDADKVRESIKRFDPGAEHTLAEMEKETAKVVAELASGGASTIDGAVLNGGVSE